MEDSFIDGFPAEAVQILKIFHPRSFERMNAAWFDPNFRFVHYTSAEAAFSIIQNNSVWMRNVSCMNDFMEVEHGRQCLAAAYNGPSGDKLKSLMNKRHAGLTAEFEALFNGWAPTFERQSYVFCVSEHDAAHDEDRYGRLSMWRAYGNQTRVALVLNKGPFLRPSDALSAYSSPVEYHTPQGFERDFLEVVSNLEREQEFISTLDRDEFTSHLFDAFRLSLLCSKSYGFHEEKEWRVIYLHELRPSQRLKRNTKIINGVPQGIFEIPLENVPEEGLFGVDMESILNRIIIGPTEFPTVARDAFVHLLNERGVSNAEDKVWVSHIPLR